MLLCLGQASRKMRAKSVLVRREASSSAVESLSISCYVNSLEDQNTYSILQQKGEFGAYKVSGVRSYFLFYAIAEPVAGNRSERARTNTRLRFSLCLWPPSALLALFFDSWDTAHAMKDLCEQQADEINTQRISHTASALHPHTAAACWALRTHRCSTLVASGVFQDLLPTAFPADQVPDCS